MAEVRIVEGSVFVIVRPDRGKPEGHEFKTIQQLGQTTQIRVSGASRFWALSGGKMCEIDREPGLPQEDA